VTWVSKVAPLIAVLLAWSVLLADDIKEPESITYQARISARDHMNHKGVVLWTAANIIRQDRYHVHSGTHVDTEDGMDGLFSEKSRRDKLARLLAQPGSISSTDALLIQKGEPMVEVEVWTDRVKVRVLHPPKTVQEQVQEQTRNIQRQEHKVQMLTRETQELKRMLQLRRLKQLDVVAAVKGWDKGALPFVVSGQLVDPTDVPRYFQWRTLQREFRK
jgi:hypothetical protein